MCSSVPPPNVTQPSEVSPVQQQQTPATVAAVPSTIPQSVPPSAVEPPANAPAQETPAPVVPAVAAPANPPAAV